jgi:hypothetical protein
LPTTTEYKIPTHHTHSHPHPPPTTAEQHHITSPPSTEKPRVSYYETTTQLPSTEKITNAANADSALGGHHGPGVAVIAGVSVSVVVLVVLAAVVITAVVVFVVWKKQAPQSRGFSKLSMTSMDKNAVAV